MIATTTEPVARFIASRLGEGEICVRLYGREEAARLAYHVALTSPLSWAAFAPDGEPVAMFGAFPDDDEPFAHGWMYSTARTARARKSVYLGVREGLRTAREKWGEVRIDAEPRLDRQARFLERIGFRPRSIETIGDQVLVELAA